MATVVCQGLQSCLETQLAEARKFTLKLSSPKLHFSQPFELALKSRFTKEVEEKIGFEEFGNKTSICSSDDKGLSSLPDMGGWSFLQALSTVPRETNEQEKPYVHPMVKRSLSSLSAKSLELCTENLGNETGSDISDGTIFSLSSSGYEEEAVDRVHPEREQAEYSRQLCGARDKKSAASRDFPPPLTTISGSASIRVRSHRDDGRLVIEAVKVPSPRNNFKAERRNGRLRLLLLDYEEETEADMDMINEESENGGRLECEGEDQYDEPREGAEEEGDEEEPSGSDRGEEDMEGIRVNAGGELGMENFQRGGRCKKGEHELHNENKRLLNWEPFWVATS